MTFNMKWYVKNGIFLRTLLILFSIITVFTFVYYYGLSFVQNEYARAGMTYQVDNPTFHPYYVYIPFGRIPYSPMIFIDNIILDFLFPLILAFGFIDIEFNQRKANLRNNILIGGGKKSLVKQYLSVIIISFIALFMALLFQILIARVYELIVDPIGTAALLQSSDYFLLIGAAAKIALYFSSLVGFGFSIGLYLNRLFPLTYIAPMLINVILVLTFPRNIPSRLGFIDTFGFFSVPETLWLYIGLVWGLSLLGILPKLLQRDVL